MINIYTTSRLLAVSVGTIAFTITGINAAQAAKFTSINIFGDSLSDPENIFNVTGRTFPPAPYDQGRFSNGPIWTDYLANHLGLNPAPYTTGLTPTQGVNYAFGGATSGTENISYLFDSRLTGLPGLQTQVGAFIQPLLKQNKSADANALYVLWAGANDYTYGGSNNTNEAVGNLSLAINNLYNIGARNFFIGNLPDLSQTPLGSSGALVPPGDLQKTVQDHNNSLTQEITRLNQSLFNSKIALFDVNNLFADVINNQAKYGFTNVTNQCFSLTFLCSNPDEYLFWDDFHPTTQGHKLIANAAYTTIQQEFKELKSTPEPNTIFALTGIGLGFLLLKKNKKAA